MEIRALFRLVTFGLSSVHRELTVDEAVQAWRVSPSRSFLAKVRLVVDVAILARIQDPVAFAGLPVIGLMLIAAGSLTYTGGPNVATMFASVMTATSVIAMALLFRSRYYRPLVGAAIGLLIAVALIWEVSTASVTVLGDMMASLAMTVVALLVLAAFGGLVGAGRVPIQHLPGEIRNRGWILRAWQCLVTSLLVIALGDVLSAHSGELLWRVEAGLMINAVGLGILAVGLARALVVSPALVTGTDS